MSEEKTFVTSVDENLILDLQNEIKNLKIRQQKVISDCQAEIQKLKDQNKELLDKLNPQQEQIHDLKLQVDHLARKCAQKDQIIDEKEKILETMVKS